MNTPPANSLHLTIDNGRLLRGQPQAPSTPQTGHRRKSLDETENSRLWRNAITHIYSSEAYKKWAILGWNHTPNMGKFTSSSFISSYPSLLRFIIDQPQITHKTSQKRVLRLILAHDQIGNIAKMTRLFKHKLRWKAEDLDYFIKTSKDKNLVNNFETIDDIRRFYSIYSIQMFLTIPIYKWCRWMDEDKIKKELNDFFNDSNLYERCKYYEGTLLNYFSNQQDENNLFILLNLQKNNPSFNGLPLRIPSFQNPSDLLNYLKSNDFIGEIILNLPQAEWFYYHSALAGISGLLPGESMAYKLKNLFPARNIEGRSTLMEYAQCYDDIDFLKSLFEIMNQKNIRFSDKKADEVSDYLLNLPLPLCFNILQPEEIRSFLIEVCGHDEALKLEEKLKGHSGKLFSLALRERNDALIERLLELDSSIQKKELIIPPSSRDERKLYFASALYETEVLVKAPVSSWPIYLKANELEKYSAFLSKYNIPVDSPHTLWEFAVIEKKSDLAELVLDRMIKISGKTPSAYIFDLVLRNFYTYGHVNEELSLIRHFFKKIVSSSEFDVNAPLDPKDPYSRPVWKLYNAILYPIMHFKDGKLMGFSRILQYFSDLKESGKEIDWNLSILENNYPVSLIRYFLKSKSKSYFWHPEGRKFVLTIIMNMIQSGVNPYLHQDQNGLRDIDHIILWSKQTANAPKNFDKSKPKKAVLRAQEELCQILDQRSVIGPNIWHQISNETLIAAFHHPKYRKSIMLELDYIRNIQAVFELLQHAFLSSEHCINILKRNFDLKEKEIRLPSNSKEATEFFYDYGVLPFDAVPCFVSTLSNNRKALFAKIMNPRIKAMLLKEMEGMFQKLNQGIETQLPWKNQIAELLRMGNGSFQEAQLTSLQALLQKWQNLKLDLKEIDECHKLFNDRELKYDPMKWQALEEEIQKLTVLLPHLSESLDRKVSSFKTSVESSLKHLAEIFEKEADTQKLDEFLVSEAKGLKIHQEALTQELKNWKELLHGLGPVSEEEQKSISGRINTVSHHFESWGGRSKELQELYDSSYLEKKYEDTDSLILISSLVSTCLNEETGHNNISPKAIAEYLGMDLQYIYSYLSSGKDLASLGIDLTIEIACNLYEKHVSKRPYFLGKIKEALETRKARLQSLQSKKIRQLIASMSDMYQMMAKSSENNMPRLGFLNTLKHAIQEKKSIDPEAAGKNSLQIETQEAIERIDRLITHFTPSHPEEEVMPCIKEIIDCDLETRRLLLRMFLSQKKLIERLQQLLEEKSLSEGKSLADLQPKGFYDIKNLMRLDNPQTGQSSHSRKRKREENEGADEGNQAIDS